MFTKVNVFIELGNDGTYGAYIGGKNPLPFGVIGEGSTVAEAKQDFLDVVEEYKADGEKVPDDVEFVFSYDVPSFLSQGQLSHYVTGRRKPSKKTVEKIQSGLNTFGQELSHLHLV